MAKRDIPEINAGSMADIAFLLLIFFLVTTTMDRDQAYIRRIPKKIDVIDPPKVQQRNIFLIQVNPNGDLRVGSGGIEKTKDLKNIDELSDRVIEFFKKNEGLTKEETFSIIQSNDPSYPGYNFPFYSYTSMEEIEKNIVDLEDKIEALENDPQTDPVIIEFEYSMLSGYEDKKKALKAIGENVLQEIHPQAHISIKVRQKTEYSQFAKIQSELHEAIYQLRDDACRKYFDESYGNLTRRIDNDQKREDIEKKKVLEVLYPDRFIEVKPKI